MKKKPIVVKRYKKDIEYQKDCAKMIARGYEVSNVLTQQPRAGFGRILLIGFFALMFKPQPVIIVTYKLIQ